MKMKISELTKNSKFNLPLKTSMFFIVLLLMITLNFAGTTSVAAEDEVALDTEGTEPPGLAEKLGLSLGSGAGEIADEIYHQLAGEAEIFVYEAYQPPEAEEAEVSTIMFLLEKEEREGFIIHNLPLRTILTAAEAEELAVAVNQGQEADYLQLNLSYFIDVIDLYGEVEVETARGTWWMDSKAARRYLEEGLTEELKDDLAAVNSEVTEEEVTAEEVGEEIGSAGAEDDGDYELERHERQEQILWAIRNKMDEEDGLPSLSGLASIFYRGLRDIDTSLGFFNGIELGVRFMRAAPDDVDFYQADADEYQY